MYGFPVTVPDSKVVAMDADLEKTINGLVVGDRFKVLPSNHGWAVIGPGTFYQWTPYRHFAESTAAFMNGNVKRGLAERSLFLAMYESAP